MPCWAAQEGSPTPGGTELRGASDEELMRCTSVGYFLGMLCTRCMGRGGRGGRCVCTEEGTGQEQGEARGATGEEAGVEDVVTSVV
jgi:hypothetical protein